MVTTIDNKIRVCNRMSFYLCDGNKNPDIFLEEFADEIGMDDSKQTEQVAPNDFLNFKQTEMLSLYKKADTEERTAILKQIDGFLPVINQEQKIFWLQFRRKLEKLNERQTLFPLGKVFMTVGARDNLEEAKQDAIVFLSRHQTGDWGNVCEEDAKENELSVKEGFRILSVYETNLGKKFWIITEADRSATTFLLPSEY